MSTSLRTWIAALLLAGAFVVMTLGASPMGLGQRAGLALLIVLAHAWVVAVGERSCVHHGGLRVNRFPIAPRLVASSPGPFPQLLVMVVLLGFVTKSWVAAGVAFGVVSILTVDLLRRVSPLILAVGALLHALATMPEFHTLGDLLETMKGWVMTLVWLILAAGILAGPLLRTDAATPYRPTGTVLVFFGGLFTYLGGAWLLSETAVFAADKLQPFGYDVYAIALGLLVGGLIQSLIVGIGAKSTGLFERDPMKIPLVSGHRVGEAMMPMAMPLLALVLLTQFPLSAPAAEAANATTWTGLFAVLLVVPLIPGAVIVAAALDRVDSQATGRLHTTLAMSVLGAWFALGPELLRIFHAPDGLADGLRGWSGIGTQAAPFASTSTETSSLMLFGLPAADLCRSITVMVLVCAALSARLMRRAPDQGRSIGNFVLGLMFAVQVGASWWLMPRLGPVGTPLAAAASAALVYGWCLVSNAAKQTEAEPKGTGEDVMAEMAVTRAIERAEQAAIEQRALQ